MNADFSAMSNQELRRYFIEHRDTESFHAYMDRRYAKPRQVLIEAGELDHLPFEEQVKIVEERMRSHFGDTLGQASDK